MRPPVTTNEPIISNCSQSANQECIQTCLENSNPPLPTNFMETHPESCKCIETFDGPTCKICPLGFRYDSDADICRDIDECLEDKHNCLLDNECFNVGGSFQCHGDIKNCCQQVKVDLGFDSGLNGLYDISEQAYFGKQYFVRKDGLFFQFKLRLRPV